MLSVLIIDCAHVSFFILSFQDWIVGPPRDVGRVKKCQTCSGNLSLLCQLSTSYDEGKLRVVYIFVCSDGKCSENDRSWIALRYNGKTENTSLTTSASPSTVASLHAPASFNQAPLTLDIPVLDGDKDDWLSLAYQDAAVASSSCRPSEEEQIFSALPVPAQSDAASSVAPNDSLTQNGCDPPISEIESSGGFQFPSAYISVQREPEAVLDYYEDSLGTFLRRWGKITYHVVTVKFCQNPIVCSYVVKMVLCLYWYPFCCAYRPPSKGVAYDV
eukprot:GHVT01025682.1.p2 GENE.GHVT01025682.1~~GHVT01025682.1.p2  ORF type:complete len:273 (-),score=17.03 GHVT01025682.1:700-1518(-)